MDRLDKYVTSIERSHLEGHYSSPKGDCIIMPIEFYPLTIDMVYESAETRGVLLCSWQEGGIKVVQSVIKIGHGDAGSVFGDERKVRAMNQLLSEHKGQIGAIDFHTHTVDTGEYWSDKFSNFENGGGDFGTFRKYLSFNPNYTHVLFTPSHILTFGSKKPSFRLSSKPNPASWGIFRKWESKFRGKLSR